MTQNHSDTTEPVTPGWYHCAGSSNALVFLLDRGAHWYVIIDNGHADECDWSYIDQMLGAFDLVLLAPLGGGKP